MTGWDSVRTAWAALAQNKLRSVLTMLGMVIGVAAVATIISIGRGARLSVQSQLMSLGTDTFSMYVSFEPPRDEQGRPLPFSPRSVQMMTFEEEDMERVKAHIPDAQYVTTTFRMGTEALYKGARQGFDMMGLYPDYADMMGVEVEQGRLFSPEEYEEGARLLILHPRTLEQLMPGVADPIGETVTMWGYPFEVIGVLKQTSGTANRMFGGGDTNVVPVKSITRFVYGWRINQLFVKVRPGADLDRASKLSQEFLQQIHPGMTVRVFSPLEMQQTAGQVTGTVAGMYTAIAAISLLVGGVGIMNIMIVSVAERTREIGLRKALGATDEDILLQFLVESVVTALTGGVFGLLFALLPVFVAGKWLQVPTGLGPDAIGLALGFSGGIGLVFGVYPALQAARLDPIEALRQE